MLAPLVWAALPSFAVRAAATPELGIVDGKSSRKRFLPLFPLGIVVVPRRAGSCCTAIEPRYRQLMTESGGDRATSSASSRWCPAARRASAREMRVERVVSTDDAGNMEVAARGVRVFELHEFQREGGGQALLRGHRRVSAQRAGGRSGDPGRPGAALQSHALSGRLPPTPSPSPYPENLSFHIAHDVGLSQAQELRLLSMTEERDRQVYLFQHLLRNQ